MKEDLDRKERAVPPGIEIPGIPARKLVNPQPADTGSFGWAVLGFFFPIVGLILFLVWKSEKPVSAKQAGMGALASVISTVVLWILLIVFAAMSGSAVTY